MAEFIMDSCGVGENGNLTIAGVDTVALAKEYGTPLMVFDENKIRSICRTYKKALEETCFFINELNEEIFYKKKNKNSLTMRLNTYFK